MAPSGSSSEVMRGSSRLFCPYRSLGIVSNGPMHVIHHQDSSNAMACTAIGERFQILQCDKLSPVLVSRAVPGNAQSISHLIADSTLDITLVAHDTVKRKKRGRSGGDSVCVTLYSRARPVFTISKLAPPSQDGDGNYWTLRHMMHLGRVRVEMTGEKEGRKENVVLCALILSKGRPQNTHEGDHDMGDAEGNPIPVVGDDEISDGSSVSDSSTSLSDDSSSDSDSSLDEPKKDCNGCIVLLFASRTNCWIHKRIPLDKTPTFSPRVAIHPPTYVNKIVIGGQCSKKHENMLILLNIKSGKTIFVFSCLPKPRASKGFNSKGNKLSARSEITSLENSPAIDTIAVGTSQGMVHLINTRHDRLLFSLTHRSRSNSTVRITSMSFRTDGSALQYRIAPLAVGRSDGTVSIWDLSPPENESDEEGGGGALLGRTLLCEMEQVHHPGGVAHVEYMPQEPVLISTGTHSNAILMHIFDNPDHSGRLLRKRSGHTAPPRSVRYLHPGSGAGGGILANMSDGTDAEACQILSGGSTDRTFRIFSYVRSVLDREFSQGKGLEKRAKQFGMVGKQELLLPPVKGMAISEPRSRDWGDIVTIHADHAIAYVWSSKRKAQSGPVLRQNHWNVSAMKIPPPASVHATSLAISSCGNFALVGTRGGVIYQYNIQSGNTRGSYPIASMIGKEQEEKSSKGNQKLAGNVQRTTLALEKKLKNTTRASNQDKHDRDVVEQAKAEQQRNLKLQVASHLGHQVTGVAVDSVNKTVISVGSDAKLILWSFKTHAPHKRSPFILPGPATKMCHVRDSDLTAIALEDFSVILFDCVAHTIVRRFGVDKSVAHMGPISDLVFSPDGRTLYTSSMDGTIRVWDVSTNSCTDWMKFSTPPTSMTVSPTGEFLATSHAGRLGISMWSDKSFYQTVHVDGSKPLTSPALMDDPIAVAEGGDVDAEENVPAQIANPADMAQGEENEEPEGPALPKESGLITLSGLPPSHWKNLFYLELVKQRNKPKEAPKKPPTAPFFLQWRQGESLNEEVPIAETGTDKKDAPKELPMEEWDAVWSDDGEEDGDERDGQGDDDQKSVDPDKLTVVKSAQSAQKKRKVSHYRSHLATLLVQCGDSDNLKPFQPVSDYISTLGPSAIDLAMSSLCNGMHDLVDGLPLLQLASQWMRDACRSRERYEAVNAYLHRFLHIHAEVIAGIQAEEQQAAMDESDSTAGEQKDQERRRRQELINTITELRQAQQSSSEALNAKMENTLCLLRHFSRMV